MRRPSSTAPLPDSVAGARFLGPPPQTALLSRRSLDADALALLPRLRELSATDCGLRSAAGAARLPGLASLQLAGNRLADGGEAERLVAALAELEEVSFAGNPLARRPVRLVWRCLGLAGRGPWGACGPWRDAASEAKDCV